MAEGFARENSKPEGKGHGTLGKQEKESREKPVKRGRVTFGEKKEGKRRKVPIPYNK